MDKQDKAMKIISGTFDCEEYWRGKDLAKLPSVKDNQAKSIVTAMDELLFVFADSTKGQDIVITYYQMNKEHTGYLNDIGFRFKPRGIVQQIEDSELAEGKNISRLLLERPILFDIKSENSAKMEYCPFAIEDNTWAVCEKFGLDFHGPDFHVVRKVNSKVYSACMNQELNLFHDFSIVRSSQELQEKGAEYLETSSFLIKDIYGVSGKGNLLVSSPKILGNVVRYLSQQERNGKRVRFIVEPFLEKEQDFSCQFYIDFHGNTEILSVQEIRNKNFAYEGTYAAKERLLELLDEKGYFEIIRKTAKKLYDDGYFGHVCIDSMVLRNGEIIPVVEINARRSMSLMKYRVDKYLAGYRLNCSFTYYSLSFHHNVEFGELLEKMEKGGLLYKPGKERGILPLSANSLMINQKIQRKEMGEKYVKGRFYVAVVYQNHKQHEELKKEFTEFLKKNSFCVI